MSAAFVHSTSFFPQNFLKQKMAGVIAVNLDFVSDVMNCAAKRPLCLARGKVPSNLRRGHFDVHKCFGFIKA